MLNLAFASLILWTAAVGAAPVKPVPLKTPRPAVWCAAVMATPKLHNAYSEKAAVRIIEAASTTLFNVNAAPRTWLEKVRLWWRALKPISHEVGAIIPDVDVDPSGFAGKADAVAAELRVTGVLQELERKVDDYKPKAYLVQGRDSIRAYLEAVENEADRLERLVAPPSKTTKTGIDVTRAGLFKRDVRDLVAALSLNAVSLAVALHGMHVKQTPSVLAGTLGVALGYYLVRRALVPLKSSRFARHVQSFARPADSLLHFTDGVLDLVEGSADLTRAFAFHSTRVAVPRAGFDGQRMLPHHITQGLDRMAAGEYRGTVYVSIDQFFYYDEVRHQPSLLTLVRQ